MKEGISLATGQPTNSEFNHELEKNLEVVITGITSQPKPVLKPPKTRSQSIQMKLGDNNNSLKRKAPVTLEELQIAV